jgi:uncharacterized protein (TIGR02266 family)
VHPRLGIQIEVGFLGHDNFYTGFTEDISEGGLFIATYALLPIGTEIDLDFVLPEGSEVHARCVVRWIRDPRNTDADTPPGMGLQFLELSQANQQRIEAFTKHREPLFYED